jgi:putative spermidine/putrescine transport system substrate-binding protein
MNLRITAGPIAAVVTVLGLTMANPWPAAAQSVVTFTGWGGVTQEAERKAYLEGAAKELGLTVREDSHNGYSSIKAHVESGARSWDVVGSSIADCVRATKNGLTQALDYGVIRAAGMPKEFVMPNCVALWTFSYGITYRKDVYRNGGPKSWAEFWDVKAFPGRRSLFSNGRYLLEAALMADGVPPAEVYAVLQRPGGVDRAFKKLEQIKPHVAVWWGSQGQAMQLIKDKEVDMLILANGRAQALIDEGAPIAFEYNQAILDIETFMVLKGAPNPADAMKLIDHSLKPVPQALFTKYIPYGPTNPKAYDTGVVPKEQLAILPTAPDNLRRQAVLSAEWYASPEGEASLARIARLIQ